MFILYELIFIIFAIAYLPYLLVKRKLHRGLFQRLGFLPSQLKIGRPIWIHAVSVGEARVAESLVKSLREIYPEKNFAISTITLTGNRIVRNFQKEGDFVFYLPLDLSFITRKVIRRLKPGLCIIAETEIWPNLITNLFKMNVPIILINARISDRSFLGYRIIKPLIKPILNKINLFCVQSPTDAQRLLDLGVESKKIEITGNMKFDLKDYIDFEKDYTDYRLKLGLKYEERLFVAGSTHPGEEEIMLNTYKKLLSEFPNLRLLFAPRHPERAAQIESLVNKFGFTPIKISKLSLSAIRYPLSAIFILDTIGQLMNYYAIADIVFVGGSLIKKGGHNILEPAYFSKPILFGPYMFNFRDISDLFLRANAGIMVSNALELLEKMRFLLRNSSELKNFGKRAKQLVLENQGATKRNVKKISLFISHG